MVMSFGALVGVVCNALVVPFLTARFTEQRLLLFSVVGLTVSMLLYTLCTSYIHLLLVIFPSTVCSTLLYTLSASAMSNSVMENETGTAVSISHSLRSFLGVLSPPLGGYILRDHGFAAVGYVAAVLTAVAAFFVFLQGERLRTKPAGKTA
jgi:predicted MFS family arabinose efflux permease